jgi:pyridoxine kinase
VFSAEEIAALIEGIAARGVFARCDAVLSGYLGEAGIGSAILDAAARARTANPAALYCCDPVIGDDGRGVFVRSGIPHFLREHALPAADIATPNRFELALLTGEEARTLAGVKRAAMRLQAGMRPSGPRSVLVSGLATETTPADAIDLLVAEGGAFHLLRTPRLARHFNGAGDVLAALYLRHRLASGSAAEALSVAASSLWGLLRATAEQGAEELLLVAAQDEVVRPSMRFRAEPV